MKISFSSLFVALCFSAGLSVGIPLPPATGPAGEVTAAAATNLTVINARSFGFLLSATAAENTVALQKISAHINKVSGGVKLLIDKGGYRVGKEDKATAGIKGYSYMGQTMLKITGCTKPVVIEGNGATIRFADGLHFGSFEAKTGKAFHAKPGGFYNNDFHAYPQNLIALAQNKSVTVRNLVLDGNVQNMAIGGYWGDVGIQLPADGIACNDNEEVTIENITSKFFPRDGIQVGNSTPDEKAPVKKVFLLNSSFTGNTRQGLSWVGGNHLLALNCKFTNTGKTLNVQTKKAVSSAPGAGIDMEAELGLIRNGRFENCLIENNAGAGLLSVGDVASITYNGGKIVGATSWSIYASGPKMSFTKTTIVGSPVNLRTGSGPNDKDNTQFNNCLITLDSALSSTGQVYGNYVMDFGGGAGGIFTACTIDSKSRGTVYGGSGCVFTNCTFKQGPTAAGYNGYPFMSGNFYGTNRWYRPGAGVMPANLDRSKFYGAFYVNGVEVTKGLKM